jgi:hypothetical protein
MIGNFVDCRTDRTDPRIDAVSEPSVNEEGMVPPEQCHFDLDLTIASGEYFAVRWQYQTTVRDAILRAETDWPFPVTVYAYDAGSGPCG